MPSADRLLTVPEEARRLDYETLTAEFTWRIPQLFNMAIELQRHVRNRLAAHEVPRRIEFLDELPRTTTRKIMRRALRSEGV